MKDTIKETLSFTDLTSEEKEKRGILGRLYGPCADFINPTRNGRKYSDELWEKVFNQDLVKEAFANGGIFGELDHPQDRQEICSEKIAICMPEVPKKDKDGHYIAYFDILDTPCGRIAYELAKYGYKLGISSRGTGDVYDDGEEEVVDPDTYDFTCFDLVITPSVKEARMKMTEGLDTNALKFKKALQESFDKSNADEKKVMQETLQDLKIDIITDNSVNIDDVTSKQTLEEHKEAIDDGTSEVIKSLQEALKDKSRLETEIKSLQEKLAVSNTKVDEINEELERYKSTTVRLSSIATGSKEMSKKVSTLEEALKKNKQLIEKLKSRNSMLVESKKTSLKESAETKNDTIKTLNEDIDSYKKEIKSLTEQLTQEKSKSTKQTTKLAEELNKTKKMCESYKTLANDIVERYLDTKATMMGINKNELKNKLSESYTLQDIDNACEEIQTNALNISRLPFRLDRKVKVSVNESKNETIKTKLSMVDDDCVDESLMRVAGLDK